MEYGGQETLARWTWPSHLTSLSLSSFFQDFIYLFSERGERREKEKERNMMCERNK